MIATLFVNGRKVGSLEYDLPKDENGKTIPLPRSGPNPGDVSVTIKGDEHEWFGLADLLDVSE